MKIATHNMQVTTPLLLREGLGVGLLLLLFLLLLFSCSKDHETTPPDKQGGVLNIYVYPSDDPMVTRADDGRLNPYTLERDVKSLKIWVFKHDNSADTDIPLHYLSPDEPQLLGTRPKLFQIALTEAQVEALTGDAKQVDVYVLANAESVGLSALNETSTRAQVRDALIASDYFGTTTLTTDISANGLPMSGCADNISVVGTYPVLSLPVVHLTRCVSKLRFVMAQNKDVESSISINSIQLNGNLFPESEYVFNTTNNPYRLSGSYISGATSFTPVEVAKTSEIANLIYDSQNIQDYEDLVDKIIADGEASQLGPYYFRESDRSLTGTIEYTITDENNVQLSPKTKNFSMSDVPGNYNFSRNHTWMVYVYYLGGEELQLILAYIRAWNEVDLEHGLYNW